jgi:hypothetical protein
LLPFEHTPSSVSLAMRGIGDKLLHEIDAATRPLNEAVDFTNERGELSRRRHAQEAEILRVALPDHGLKASDRGQGIADGERSLMEVN